MRKLFAVIAVALLMACKAGQIDTKPAGNKAIYGKWKLLNYSGGFAGGTHKAENITEIAFDKSSFKRYKDGELDLDIKYSVQKGESIYATGPVDLVVYSNGSLRQSIRKVTTDTLVLADEAYDAYTYTYLKTN